METSEVKKMMPIKVMNTKLKSILQYNDFDSADFKQWFFQQFRNDSSISLVEFSMLFLNDLRTCTNVHFQAVNITMPMEEPGRRDADSPIFTQTNDLRQMKSTNDVVIGRMQEMHLEQATTSPSTPQRRRSTTSVNLLSYLNASPSNAAASPAKANSEKKQMKHRPMHQFQQRNRKQKKRLVPTTIDKQQSDGRNETFNAFGGQSSFSNVNNIRNLSPKELEEGKGECTVTAARRSLAFNTQSIRQELKTTFESILPPKKDYKDVQAKSPAYLLHFELDANDDNLYKDLLEKLTTIYNLLINSNLVANILHEISFVLNILGCIENDGKSSAAARNSPAVVDDDTSVLKCLESRKNATHFAILMLKKQLHIVSLLDLQTLNVICHSTLVNYLPECIRNTLQDSYAKKVNARSRIESELQQNFTIYNANRNAEAVYFQEDINSRHNFGTQQEFSNFRCQRDLFYSIWNIWRNNHIHPNWNFSKALRLKIQQIFQQSENLINMIHFAKLFVSLILTASRNAITPTDIGLSDIDINKFNKLEKRFTQPSAFSVEHQFPHNQSFFRDFIIASHSVAFIEQLKLELHSELLKLSAWDLDQTHTARLDIEINTDECKYHIVRREILFDLIVLAKFFGFVSILPFAITKPNNKPSVSIFNTLPTHMANHQLELRNRMHCNYDFYTILCNALHEGKLLIVIPWLVQFLAMLDDVTLQLDDNVSVLNMLFAIYINLASEGPCVVYSRMGVFVLRLCIGWLISLTKLVTKQYYNYYKLYHQQKTKNTLKEMKVIEEYLKQQNDVVVIVSMNRKQFEKFDSFLHSVLMQVCPFLAEFRVSIMSFKNYEQCKQTSRNGRYRRITTYILDVPPSNKNIDDDDDCPVDKTISLLNDHRQRCTDDKQKYLREYFLITLSIEMRQLIKYCIESCYKSLVKDCETNILTTSKASAAKLCNDIVSSDFSHVYETVKKIYADSHADAVMSLRQYIRSALQERIHSALRGLLPATITPILTKTYGMIIEQDVMLMMHKWLNTNVLPKSSFDINLEDVAKRLCASNEGKQQIEALLATSSNLLCIKNVTVSIADFMRDLQFAVHCASSRPDLYAGTDGIITQLSKFPKLLEENVLPTAFYHLIASNIIYLMQNIITHHPDDATRALMLVACSIWKHPKVEAAMQMLRVVSRPSNAEDEDNRLYQIYDTLLDVPFLTSFGDKRLCFQKLCDLLIMMIKRKVISSDFTSSLFVGVLKNDWPMKPLTYISRMLAITSSSVLKKQNLQATDDGNADDGEEEDSDISSSCCPALPDLDNEAEYLRIINQFTSN